VWQFIIYFDDAVTYGIVTHSLQRTLSAALRLPNVFSFRSGGLNYQFNSSFFSLVSVCFLVDFFPAKHFIHFSNGGLYFLCHDFILLWQK
jgi:hypothetical protein